MFKVNFKKKNRGTSPSVIYPKTQFMPLSQNM